MKTHNLSVKMMGLGTLLDAVDRGAIALPDFQRDFEWASADIEQMLVTALNAWPAGSLLLLEGGASFFELKAFRKGPSPVPDAVRYVVLDGQQRITALYHAIFNRGDRIYYIDAATLLESGELEDAIQAVSRGKWENMYGSPALQAKHLVIPCSALRSPTAFFEWRDEVVEWERPEARLDSRKRLTAIYQKFLSPIHTYEFPAVVLEDTTSPSAVARIFERVNRLGLRLNTFDLMVARTYSKDWNLRENWRDFGALSPAAFGFFEQDGMSALQVISLRLAEDVRQAAVLKLTGSQVHSHWELAMTGLRRAEDFLSTNFQASSRAELPYSILAQLLGAVFVEDKSFAGNQLLPFVWARSFGRAYDVASNSRVVADFKKIRRFGGVSEELITTDLTADDLVQAGRQGGKALSSALTLLIRTEFIEAKIVESASELVASSIFPSDLGSDLPGFPSPASRILSVVLMPRSEIKTLQKLGLQAVVRDLFDREDLIRANYLPPADFLSNALKNDQWQSILEFRARAIIDALKNRGVLFRSEAAI